jgi:glutamyl-tRNA synthetase
MSKVITRIPPSPTGFFHVGRARTALFNYLFTQKNKGKIVFRLEDTDKERSKEEYAQDIIECLAWLGIKYDEGPFRQSERNAIYQKYIQKLIDNGAAYISKETEGDRAEVIRFKNPNKKVTFTDLIRGDVTMDTTDLGDFVIARSMEEPLYHLTVVVDDHEMGVTHVIRGDDGISNTPRQILIQEGIGAQRPTYAHIPLILAADRSKLSGRHGAVSVNEFKKMGYLPEALVNFLALLGWNPGTEQELFSMDELIEVFTLEKVQKNGAVFNIEKLNWFNQQYIKKMSDDEFKKTAELFGAKNVPAQIFSLLKEKISFFGQIPEILDKEFAFMLPIKSIDPVKLAGKSDAPKDHLKKVIDSLSSLKNFSKEEVKNAVWAYAEEKGKGNVLWPMRFGLSGQDRSPDPFIIAEILGKEESIKRLTSAYEAL